MKGFLTTDQRIELLDEHRHEHDRRFADRIKTILHLDAGWSYQDIAEALFLDDSTIRRYEKNYQVGGLECLLTDNYKGGFGLLSSDQLSFLKDHLSKNTYLSCKEIVVYIKEQFGVDYKVGGVLHLLKRLGFVYKKPKQIPGKANAEAQEEFVRTYYELLGNKAKNDPIYFADGTHPHHNSNPAYGWFPKGQTAEIKTNTGRKRINFNGAIDTHNLHLVIRDDETINADSTLALFGEIERRNPNADNIYVIADNARYYKARKVKEFLQTSKITILFLPPYSPNLNLIERLWRFFKKKVLYNKYYEKFDIFHKKCLEFFNSLDKYASELKSLLTDKFQIIGA